MYNFLDLTAHWNEMSFFEDEKRVLFSGYLIFKRESLRLFVLFSQIHMITIQYRIQSKKKLKQ